MLSLSRISLNLHLHLLDGRDIKGNRVILILCIFKKYVLFYCNISLLVNSSIYFTFTSCNEIINNLQN